MAITHDLIAKSGEYQKDGETKARWTKVGVAMTNKSGGTALLIEQLPVNFDGWIQMRDPLPPKNGVGTDHSSGAGDSIPF